MSFPPTTRKSAADRIESLLDTFEALKMTYPKSSAKRRRELLSIRKGLARVTVWGSGLANEYAPEPRSIRDYGNTDTSESSGKIPRGRGFGRGRIDSLAALALDLRWSWNHATDQMWRQLDPVLWDFTHNPWAVLQTVSRITPGGSWPSPHSASRSVTSREAGWRQRRRLRGFSRLIRSRHSPVWRTSAWSSC